MVNIKTKYDYENHIHPGIHFGKDDRSMTNQADMDAADINKIMARFEKTGVLIDGSGIERQPMHGDFSEVRDYHGMLIAVREAERRFYLYPAAIRNRFDNDPQKLIDFMEDPKNDKEAVKLGLKDRSVLKTALADDGVTRITPEERENLDKLAAAKAAAGASGTGTGS